MKNILKISTGRHLWSPSLRASLCLLGAALLSACVSDEATTAGGSGSTATAGSSETPITLSASVVGRQTRSGSTGSIDYSLLTKSDYGFGAFAHRTAGTAAGWTDWENKAVTYNGPTPAENPGTVFDYPGSWVYDAGTPKYWRADAGDNASIDFFAYAPYVASPAAGTGITAIGGTAASPTVGYTIATQPENSVDLLWGVKGDTGLPWNATTLAATGGPVLFTFRHALAAIGLHVQAMIDQTNDLDNLDDASAVGGILGTDYKITVKQVTIQGDFYPNATLTLKNTEANTPLWGSHGTSSSTLLTLPNAQVAAAFKHPGNASPTTTETATAIMDGTLTGVTQEAQQLLIKDKDTNGAEQLFFVIPNSTKQDYTITVDWCVCHKRETAPSTYTYTPEDHSSIIHVNSRIAEGITLDAGTKYYFNLVFNLRTVHLDVTAEDWTGALVPLNVQIEHGTSASESLAPRLKNVEQQITK